MYAAASGVLVFVPGPQYVFDRYRYSDDKDRQLISNFNRTTLFRLSWCAEVEVAIRQRS